MFYDNRATSQGLLLGAGALLACGATVKYLAYRDEARHRGLDKLLVVRSLRFYVVDRGTGPCVVLLHGAGAMVEDMQSSGLVEGLATSHGVLAFDRPGFGLSDRPSHVDWTPDIFPNGILVPACPFLDDGNGPSHLRLGLEIGIGTIFCLLAIWACKAIVALDVSTASKPASSSFARCQPSAR